MRKYIFSGHESFQCRQLWLKKGYEYIKSGKSFNDDDAVVKLGVGRNMVGATRFWMKAFGILDANDKTTPFADRLLSDEGWDPYLEDEASLWLLHYQLVRNGLATTYSLVFNELRREKIEFTKDNYVSFVQRKAKVTGDFQVNDRTLVDDFTVLTKMYLRSLNQQKDREDSFSGLLTELNLIKTYNRGKDDYFIIEYTDKTEIPDEVILYAILDQENVDTSISFYALEQEVNSVGSIFAISRNGLLGKIENLVNKPYMKMVYNDQAGVKEIQFKKKIAAFTALEKYYEN